MIRAAFIIDHLELGSLTRLKCLLKNCTQGRAEQGDEAEEVDPRDLRSVQVGSKHSARKTDSGSGRCRDASKTPIFWDTDITALEGDEIRVEVS